MCCEYLIPLLYFVRGDLSDLQVLNLQGNSISDEGVEFLAEAYLHGQEKEGNGPSRTGAQDVYACLQVLNLSDNSIGPAGVCSLSRAFCAGACPWLQILNLQKNRMGDEGAGLLKVCFDTGHLSSLQVLCVSSNGIDRSVLQSLEESAGLVS